MTRGKLIINAITIIDNVFEKLYRRSFIQIEPLLKLNAQLTSVRSKVIKCIRISIKVSITYISAWFELVQLLQIISLICMGVAFFLMIGSCVCAYFRRYKRNSRFRNILLQLLLFLCAIIFTTTGKYA